MNKAELLEALQKQTKLRPTHVKRVVDAIFDPDRPAARIRSPTDLPPDWYDTWAERAAIMEYDGNLPREEAERLARAETASLRSEISVTGNGAAVAA